MPCVADSGAAHLPTEGRPGIPRVLALNWYMGSRQRPRVDGQYAGKLGDGDQTDLDEQSLEDFLANPNVPVTPIPPRRDKWTGGSRDGQVLIGGFFRLTDRSRTA